MSAREPVTASRLANNQLVPSRFSPKTSRSLITHSGGAQPQRGRPSPISAIEALINTLRVPPEDFYERRSVPEASSRQLVVVSAVPYPASPPRLPQPTTR